MGTLKSLFGSSAKPRASGGATPLMMATTIPTWKHDTIDIKKNNITDITDRALAMEV
jgi:hypothetical protein